MKITTVFSVEGQGFEVEGSGQATVKAAIKEYPRMCVKLEGFRINGKFIPANVRH